MIALTVSLDARDRLALSATIEQLIGLLDDLDGDADLEDGDLFDDEPWLGASEEAGSQGSWAYRDASDDREDENEHGDDINDQPQDWDERELALDELEEYA